MGVSESAVDHRASAAASDFGSVIRSRRKQLKMRQSQLAMVTGVSRGFVIDLEAGKPSCHLGRSLLVADALGLRVTELLASESLSLWAPTTSQELPDLAEEVEGLDGQSTGIF